MSLYSDFITELRAELGDYPINRNETADGDGATTRFQLANPKIYDNNVNELITVGGVTQATSFYTIDRNIGQVVFSSNHIPAANNDNITFQYQSVNLLDSDYVVILNQVLQQLRRKLWIEFEDSSTLTSVIDQNNYSLATVKTNGGFTDIVFITDFEYMLATTPADPTQNSQVTNPWRSVGTVTNMRFYKDLQEIRIRPAFNTSTFPLRIKGSRAYVQGTTVSSTLELQTRYWPVVKKFCQAIYLERLALKLLQEMSALSKEATFTNATEMRKLAVDVRNEAMQMLKEVRPSKPAKMIPTVIMGMNV